MWLLLKNSPTDSQLREDCIIEDQFQFIPLKKRSILVQMFCVFSNVLETCSHTTLDHECLAMWLFRDAELY
jgi:hypothetical protein